jgi:hypothetical protein
VPVDHLSTGEKYMYVVDFFENGKLIQSRPLPDKNLYYAEDVAENWDSGLIQLLTE